MLHCECSVHTVKLKTMRAKKYRGVHHFLPEQVWRRQREINFCPVFKTALVVECSKQRSVIDSFFKSSPLKNALTNLKQCISHTHIKLSMFEVVVSVLVVIILVF